jgi:D-arginine dehydrogenase
VSAPVLVNAAGAWGDEVARLAGARPVGLQPLRRTAMLVDAPRQLACAAWPAAIALDESFYFKPDAGRLLLSPADEEPSPPCDAQPEDLEVAIAVDRFETATGERVAKIWHRWAGLRVFSADRTPVVGFDPEAEGFFWLVGQGGYGIQSAEGLGRLAAALACGDGVPAELAAEGVSPGALARSRF